MSSAGSVQAMITAMKNNARKRKSVDHSLAGVEKGSLYPIDSNKSPTHTPEQIAAAKAAFKVKAERERKKTTNGSYRSDYSCSFTLLVAICSPRNFY